MMAESARPATMRCPSATSRDHPRLQTKVASGDDFDDDDWVVTMRSPQFNKPATTEPAD
jgi:hypothetical protein